MEQSVLEEMQALMTKNVKGAQALRQNKVVPQANVLSDSEGRRRSRFWCSWWFIGLSGICFEQAYHLGGQHDQGEEAEEEAPRSWS